MASMSIGGAPHRPGVNGYGMRKNICGDIVWSTASMSMSGAHRPGVNGYGMRKNICGGDIVWSKASLSMSGIKESNLRFLRSLGSYCET